MADHTGSVLNALGQQNRFAHEQRRERVAHLYLQRRTKREIADEIGCSEDTVRNHIEELELLWRQSALRAWDDVKSQELARLDELEREYFAGWKRSCETRAKHMMVVEQRPVVINGAPHMVKYMKAVTQTEEMIGDPRFLDGVQRCIERRCAILGLDAPKLVDIEVRVREAAIAEGLDPDEAVQEARRVLREYAKVKP